MCGIVGMVSNKMVAPQIAYALLGVQHRGEQGCGIAVFNGRELVFHKEEGLVTEVFNEKESQGIFQRCAGNFGLGHTLYSTVGKGGEKKQAKTFQPLLGNFQGTPFALVHNGNLVRLDGLRREAEEKGYHFQSEVSDTEVMVALLSTAKEADFLEALMKILPRLEGAFALIILFQGKVIGVTDAHRIRPLSLGKDGAGLILASEESAFHTMGADFVREVGPGEIIVLGKHGVEQSLVWADNPRWAVCLFEFIYFARPDSRIAGQSVYQYREDAGRAVATEHPVKADFVCAVPESGRIYSSGISEALGIPVKDAIVKSRYYVKRTFMAPREIDRRALQRKKLFVLKTVVHNKAVIVSEDSIFRASVSPEVSAMLREKGASKVHFMVGSSPVRFPCFLGMDIPSRIELVAANLDVDLIGRKIVQSDSLAYLSEEGMIRASGLPREHLCLGCFTGEYPVEPPCA